MTNRERILSALEHRESDRIPFSCDFTNQERQNMISYTKDPNFDSNWDNPFVVFYYDGWPRPLENKKGYYIDDFGVIWNRNGADKDIGVVDNVPDLEPEDDVNIQMPRINEDNFRMKLQQKIEQRQDSFAIVDFGFSMFERSWSLLGMENVLIRMLLNPESLLQLYEKICSYHEHLLDIALEYEFDAVMFGDDWGQQKGLIMGAENWRYFIKPFIRRLYDKAHKHGKYVIQHSCGDCREIMDDLVEIGLNCYQTFQPEIYPIQQMKEKYGEKLTFWGGISTQQLLARATPEEVMQETIRIMRIMGPGGGYIAAPTHAVPFDVPPENILAMMEVFLHQDKYL